MKKKLFFAAVAIVALASCVDNEYVGEVSPNPKADGTNAIEFNTGAKTVTRSGEIYGAAAASLLNKNFVVEGIKAIPGDNSSTNIVEVFDNYNVNWTNYSAYTTASNSANWEYVGQSILSGKTAIQEQTIKYWDFAASYYDFWAYSLGGGGADVAALDPSNYSYTIEGSKEDLAKVYISDLVTVYPPGSTATVNGNPAPQMGEEVNLTFRSLVTKVRVGLYETIPGYSVKSVQFYPAVNGTPADDVVLYASGAVLPTVPTNGTVTYTVQFPHTTSSNLTDPDYNKAHVTLSSSTTTDSKIGFGKLSYTDTRDKYEKIPTGEAAETKIWVLRSSAQPTWAKESSANAGDYSIVLPNEDGAVLTLKVDYTLESIDGSGEEITVHGATALLPSQYTQWKPNYAYTYLFKISDNTNGLTNPSITDKVGLYPITLDAIVIAPEDGTQETITTVATPSITTYSLTSNVTTNNEYTTSDNIYITATTDGTLIDMDADSHWAKLYKITKSGAVPPTEAEVLEALTKFVSAESDNSSYVGCNGITLTNVSSISWPTSIPLIDGNSVTVTQGQVALIDQSTSAILETSSYYAFVYEATAPSGTLVTKYEYGIATVTTGDSVTGKYTTTDGVTYTEITDNSAKAVDGVTYYERQALPYYYYPTNGEYAIKVIKIQ